MQPQVSSCQTNYSTVVVTQNNTGDNMYGSKHREVMSCAGADQHHLDFGATNVKPDIKTWQPMEKKKKKKNSE